MEDEEAEAVLKAVGRQIKVWREAAGLKQPEFAARIGYSPDLVSAVERGVRTPQPEFLDNADKVVGAQGKISAMKVDVERARYPKKVRDLTKLEDETTEMGAYSSHHIHGLLQTPEYAKALYGMRRPAYAEDEIDRLVAARMARKIVFDRVPRPLITFVQEEVTLRRPIGGKMVLRKQLEHLLEISQLRHVEIQVMPTDRDEEHAGMAGPFRLLKLRDGKTLGHLEVQLHTRVVSDTREAQILEMRYGMIRSQALSPRESQAFIKEVLGEET
ncbi:helix-turn-helix domain-containing protein [Streptomyces murinus]|uniref:Transcriptional regulator with XRE-family HTH domain n=1 Tax=Streptomyces murinus TaxID=33900 RepID=A0A7W3RM93_STRMR|nr:helix-turn-helix transcriptional regulator [Streptomyces murinus]MBA9054223.1 transcriptional regulator with XRE-family HTH domain [Streptomyces murinus]UWW95250.1 helix-turn-helix domain-containing protein [Streptomyces murinus]WDO07830.1 helix-turn-helix domain-containing protein [Streptomyces murinus]